jgi:hypothetical protein
MRSRVEFEAPQRDSKHVLRDRDHSTDTICESCYILGNGRESPGKRVTAFIR